MFLNFAKLGKNSARPRRGFASLPASRAAAGRRMGTLATGESFLFEGFRLDRSGLFRRDERGAFVPVAIGSRALDVLRVLITAEGDLVSKDEIMEAVWPGTVVEDNNLTVQISALRRVLDQGRAERSCIQTAPGRGYRFVAPVRRVEPASLPIPSSISRNRAGGPEAKDGHRASLAAGLPTPDKPSIAVLPFANLSGDPEQEYFADGMVEEIITALSRIRWLFVLARNSSFTYKGQAVDVKQVARIGCPLRPRRLGAQGRPARAHCRAADRRDERRASLGRPLRRLARRRGRPSGQGGIQRGRRHRAD